jgi:hypothetical protein
MPVRQAKSRQLQPDAAFVLSKAVARASGLLGLRNSELARVLGVSAASATRLRAGAYVLKVSTKEFELAALLVRLFRSLDSITGGDDAALKSWLRAENRALDGRPIDKIVSVEGLVDVVAYLDAARAPV